MRVVTTIYIITAGLLIFLPGCHYMDESPYDWVQPEDIFSMEANYEKPINQAYSYIPDGYNRISGAFLDAATDDGMCTVDASAIHQLSRGYISSGNPVENVWNSSYQGIRQALFVQKSLSEIDIVLNNKSTEEVIAIKNTYSGEMYCLRALYEFNLLKHYGGYPVIDKYYQLGDAEIKTIARSPFEDCVNNITRLCDSAAKYLDVTPVGGSGGFGRMTKGAALAIKAKTLIYAASPLFNQTANGNPLTGYTQPSASDIQSRWEKAAEACAAVINLTGSGGAKVYSLHQNYEKLFVTSPNSEFIIFSAAGKSNALENRQYPPTLSRNSGGGTVPTQNFVDAFSTSAGLDYTGSNDASQYQNRDPRLKVIVGHNGLAYGNLGTIYTKVGQGATIDALDALKDRSTNTGYYLKKFLDVNVSFASASPATAFHLYPIIRLADILLLYAEAMNEAYGPEADPNGYGLTAKGAVSQVRRRAGFTTDHYLDNIASVETMRARIKNERRIELSFEEQRYFDLRRWMDGENLNRPVNGVRIEQKSTSLDFSSFEADPLRKFETRMYLHPIPLTETIISPQIKQNPGW